MEYDITLLHHDDSTSQVTTVLTLEAESRSIAGVRISTDKQRVSLTIPDAIKAWNDLGRAIIAAVNIDPSVEDEPGGMLHLVMQSCQK